MGRIAFVFSGQGDQFPGMGKNLYDNYPVAKDVFERFDKIRPNTSEQCFSGTEDELKETANTQPCLFAMEYAAASVLIGNGIQPEAVAGFSLGEVVAATVGRVFDPETGFRLVCKRGELMQREAEKFDTSMAAVVKLTREQVEEACSKHNQVYPVNFNCPGQITVSGLSSEMPGFFADVKALGGKAIPLKVKGAFHSPFMKEAAVGFKKEIENVEICRKASVTLYSNMTAEPYTDDVVTLLSQQICNPVQWEKIIRNLISAGFDTFIEVGPGKTLTNMIRKIDLNVKAANYMDYIFDIEEEVC
ncbi:MAG: ACP S-malonyltransferase [Ruminococcus sp.]|nr:ACP S-malonyltransferase [Ruminococcus sp.]